MRSKLLGKLLTALSLVFLLFCLASSVLTPKAYADEDFDISTNAVYQIQANGDTRVTQTISIKNKKEFVYTPSYKITLGFDDIKNVRASNSDGVIESKLTGEKEGKSIEAIFPRRVIGVGNVNQFSIAFTTSDIAKNKGSVWEVSIPGLSNPANFTSYNAIVNVPAAFGPPNIIKPFKKFTQGQAYNFNKDEIGEGGIYLLFGEAQYYSFDLTYHISNTKFVPVKTEVALPPDTSYQEVRMNSIVPAPKDVYRDSDGNWLAVYSLKPKEVKKINAKVLVKVFSTPQQISETPKPYNLGSKKYWEANDPQIKSIAMDLKTPQAIYGYVVSKLNYNYDKVSNNNVRVGARDVLSTPSFAVCLEFTDLFVALARSAGIPARAVEGYGYTQNSKLRPLSLVADVLHAWPEYYDEKSKTWIMVDPTWGNTTRGMDYFNTLDFDHVAFVIKGESSTYPVPAGGYKIDANTKDVYVQLATAEDFNDTVKSSIVSNLPDSALSGFEIEGTIIIKNEGNVPIKNKTLIVKSDLDKTGQQIPVDFILPFGQKVIPVVLGKTPFLTTSQFTVTMLFDGEEARKVINVGIFPNYFWFILGGILSVGSIIVAIAAYKTWSIYISRQK